MARKAQSIFRDHLQADPGQSLDLVAMPAPRRWDVDFARGLAVLAMVVFHLGYDLNYVAGWIAWPAIIWLAGAELIGGTFLFLAGVSLRLGPRRPALRALRLLAVGLVLTAIAEIYPHYGILHFGILHAIAVASLLALGFRKFDRLNLILGVSLLAVWFGWLLHVRLPSPWFILASTSPPRALMILDYYPWLPSLGYVLLGLYAGRRGLALPYFPPLSVRNPVCWIGRHSLLIYFFHQPVLLGALKLLGAV